VPVSVLLGAIIIALAIAFGTGGHPDLTGGQGAQQGATAADITKIKTEGEPTIGNPSAPVTMAIWFDYQCPFCKAYEVGGVPAINNKTPAAIPDIIKNYVDTGKVKIVLKDFQFLGDDSQTAALFARAVWNAYPDRFFDWYEAMMKAQDDEGDVGFGDLASIETLTKTVPGIDVAKVEALMNANKSTYQAAIAADKAEAASIGINGTPGTLIGTTVLSGAQAYADVAALLDAQLKK
jgi:protein-disulfide isomerase